MDPQEQEQLPVRLVVGRAAWWIPNPGKKKPSSLLQLRHAPVIAAAAVAVAATTSAEDTRKMSFAAALKDLLENLSFHCYGKLVEHGRRIQERWVGCGQRLV